MKNSRVYYLVYEEFSDGPCINTYANADAVHGSFFYLTTNRGAADETWTRRQSAYEQPFVKGLKSFRPITRCKARRLFREHGYEDIFDKVYDPRP